MTALVRHEDGKNFNWGADLRGDEQSGFQWILNLERIVDEEDNSRIYIVENRGWRSVGPEFAKRAEGSRFLGFTPGSKGDASKNWDRLIEEYNGLFSDEIESHEQFHSEGKKFGRPSQGRTERMQFSATPELRKWLESRMKPGENVSLVTFRLLEELRELSRQER